MTLILSHTVSYYFLPTRFPLSQPLSVSLKLYIIWKHNVYFPLKLFLSSSFWHPLSLSVSFTFSYSDTQTLSHNLLPLLSHILSSPRLFLSDIYSHIYSLSFFLSFSLSHLLFLTVISLILSLSHTRFPLLLTVSFSLSQTLFQTMLLLSFSVIYSHSLSHVQSPCLALFLSFTHYAVTHIKREREEIRLTLRRLDIKR